MSSAYSALGSLFNTKLSRYFCILIAILEFTDEEPPPDGGPPELPVEFEEEEEEWVELDEEEDEEVRVYVEYQ